MAQRRFPKLLGLALAATLATTTAAAWADAPQTGSATGHQRFQERLGLTDEQMAAIKQVSARHAAERKQIGESLRTARNELKLAALNGGDIKAKAAVVTALTGQMTELHAATLQEIAPILTPEQREAMANINPRGPHRHHGPRPTQS